MVPGRYLSGGRRCILLGVLLLFLGACILAYQPPADVRIGLIPYTQGEYADLDGIATLNAAQMAVDEINSTGGLELKGKKHKIVLVVEGILDVPEQAVAAAQKLINQENVSAIVGPQFSSDAIPAGDVAEKARVPMISPESSNPKTTAGRQYVFRMSFVNDFQGKVMASFARQDLGAGRAAVLYNIANPYSTNIATIFKKSFEDLGGQVVAFESYTTDETDFSSYLERMRSQSFEVLYLPNFPQEARLQALQIRQAGIQAVLLGSDVWDFREFKKITEFDGSFMSVNWSQNLDTEKSRSFVEKYVTQFNLEPGDSSALTYDAFQMLFQAMLLKNQTDPESIHQGLYDLPPYVGVSGTIDFKANGDPDRSAIILELKDGAEQVYKVISP